MKETLHLALANVRLKDEKKFVESITELCYKRHSNQLREHLYESNEKALEKYYKPYFYYVYGTYDFAILSLINNYDFAQKLFIPKNDVFNDNGDDGEVPDIDYNYQIITGILSNELNGDLNDKMYKDFPFLGIIKLKLNNSFLCGNGNAFATEVISLIKSEFEVNKNVKATALHSFSWFEIVLFVFSKTPNEIGKALENLRALKIVNLAKKEIIIKDSFRYSKKFSPPSEEEDKIINRCDSDVFSDTQSHFCVSKDYLDKVQINKFGSIELDSDMEWYVKPGHYEKFLKALKAADRQSGYLSFDKMNLLTGRSDYLLETSSKKFASNIKIQQIIQKSIEKNLQSASGGTSAASLKNETSILSHISYLKTNVYFNVTQKPIADTSPSVEQNLISFSESLSQNIDLGAYSKKLKSLKVSKQCRSNVLKMLYLYKTGINDKVLAIYFFDFYHFIKNILELINRRHEWLVNACNNNTNGLFKDYEMEVEKFESRLAKEFEIFEDAFSIRMLNSYKYEDIGDLNLDFNSSIQQLISMYNTLAFIIGKKFKVQQNHFLVSLNYKSTVANVSSIYYSVYDLLTPEFIFYTLPKEILNTEFTEGGVSEDLNAIINKLYDQIKDKSNVSYDAMLDEMLVKDGLIDFNYLVIEAIRFYSTFNLNKEYFVFWTWSYAFKNSSLYNYSGSFREPCFIFELFRILFTLKLYNHSIDDLKCPLPQLEQFWQRYYWLLCEKINHIYGNYSSTIGNLKAEIIDWLYDRFNGSTEGGSHEMAQSKKNSLEIREVYGSSVYPSIPNQVNILAELAAKTEEFIKKPFDAERAIKTSGNDILMQMSAYIFHVFDINKAKDDGYINFLHRDWKTGEILKHYNKNVESEKDYYYYKVDQAGGVFFPFQNKMEEYFSLRNKMLTKTLDFTMREMKELMREMSATSENKTIAGDIQYY